jgi:glyoxylase-like metal-dependent hydrolase (beta-lactamase superfamily II)
MKRADFLKNSLFATGALFLAPVFRLEAQPDGVFTELVPGAGFFTLRGGTIGWYKDKDVFVMIDSQFADTAPVFVEQFLGTSGRMVDVLINTHHHGDHTGGNKAVRGRVKQILAHSAIPEYMKKAAQTRNIPESDLALPDVTFDKEKKFKIGKETIVLKHFGAAHSAGDTIIHLQRSNVAHMGDLVFNRFPAVIDRSSGASVQNWIVVLEKAEKWFDKKTKIIFGHGSQTFGVSGKKEDLLAQRDFLAASMDFVRKTAAGGKTKEDLLKVEAVPGFDAYKRDDRKDAVGRMLGLMWDEVHNIPFSG